MADNENNIIKTKENESTVEKKPKYVNGEKYPYNRFEDTFGDAGRYSDETPRKRAFLNKTHWKICLIIAAVITFASLAMIVLFELGLL